MSDEKGLMVRLLPAEVERFRFWEALGKPSGSENNGDGSDKHGRFGLDVPKVTRDEAVELCVYHLAMASAMFEVTPDDAGLQLLEEIDRKLKSPDAPTYVSPALEAAQVWARCIYKAYADMMKDD